MECTQALVKNSSKMWIDEWWTFENYIKKWHLEKNWELLGALKRISRNGSMVRIRMAHSKRTKFDSAHIDLSLGRGRCEMLNLVILSGKIPIGNPGLSQRPMLSPSWRDRWWLPFNVVWNSTLEHESNMVACWALISSTFKTDTRFDGKIGHPCNFSKKRDVDARISSWRHVSYSSLGWEPTKFAWRLGKPIATDDMCGVVRLKKFRFSKST